jgi:hypothetical protein
MISFLFWNLGGKGQTAPYISRIAMTYAVDVFLFAECPDDLSPIVSGLNSSHRGVYGVPGPLQAKVRVFSRLPSSDLTARFTNIGGDMTVWRLRATDPPSVLLAAAHLPAKSGGTTDADQQTRAEAVSREIAEIEDEDGCRNTLLVGDLNMNPFDPGMVIVTGFHALMTKSLAARKDRRYKGRRYRRFYNPMWGLFGDRTPGPAGTYFWEPSVPSNRHWGILGQVLLRPSLMGRLRNLQILASDGYQSLLTPDGIASRGHLSDHLPILFQLDV